MKRMRKTGESTAASKRSAKARVTALLQELPEEATFEDIQYSIYVREILEQRLEELPKSSLLSQDAVERRLAKWLGR